jgi:hypothetical protein
MRTMRIAALAAAVALSLAFASCVPKSVKAPAAPAAAIQGKVAYVEGSVKIDGAVVEVGRTVAARTRVETGPASACDIVFNEKNAFRIGQNSLVTVDFTKSVPEFDLEKGGITSVLRKLEKLAGKDSYLVRTKTAAAGVRGTSFCVWCDADSTYVCACNGAVHTVDAKGSNELELKAAHHVARVYSTKDGATAISEAGILHHDDGLVEAVASRIGETVDWSKDGG